MSTVKYKNPPIKEAIFDVRFVFDTDINMSLFDNIATQLSDEYPKKETLNQQFVSFKVGDLSEPNQFESKGGPHGIRLTSVDGLHIVQFRPDGITFSRMGSYNGWETFSADAEKLIALYINVLKPEYISRLALRFINLINIPEVTFEVGHYFKTEPRLADDIKAGVLHFFMRQFIQNESGDLRVIINQTTVDKAYSDSTTKIIFDIDVFKENINIKFKSDDYKSLLTKLRDFRSEIFEKSLTDKAKVLFN